MNFEKKTPTARRSFNSRFESKQSRLKRNSQSIGSPFDTSSSSINKRIKVEYENQFNQYDFSLNLYTIPPFGQIDLEEAQKAVEERLKILGIIDDLKTEQQKSKYPNEFKFNEELNTRFKSLDNVFINQVIGGKYNVNVETSRRRDHVSHFLLRLLCCQNESLRKWFVQKEVELLKFRLDREKSTLDLVQFLAYNNLDFKEVKLAEKEVLLKQNKINYNNSKTLVANVFYKIPFEDALELVRTRRTFLQDGFCYCSSVEMITIISSKFKLELSRSLASLYNNLPQLDENNRLQPIFQMIYNNLIQSKRTNRSVGGPKESISPDMIDELAVKSFPPCMRNTHELLRLNHHLKHYARLHYGLFLKGIGLDLEDALNFFREEFIHNMTPEKFQKGYSYNIRYNYGKEGKRVNLSAFSCTKIINGNAPGIGDSHGCPFKHFDTSHLTKMLKKHNIDEENIKKMVELKSEFKYTAACSSYFACKNNNAQIPQEIHHPNQYYFQSRMMINNQNMNITQENKLDEDKQ